jgi:hypothetical protein
VGEAKQIVVKPIGASTARAFLRKNHYSGKVDTRSQLHLGVFYHGRLGGAMQFGPSIDKRRVQGLVADTPWNGWLDLHRLAFTDALPRNSESRALGIAMRLLRKHRPDIQWVLSYADATQCGDGTIYRAAGFVLTGIGENHSMWEMPDGEIICKIVLEPGFASGNAGPKSVKARYGKTGSETSTAFLRRIGARSLPGFQLRYIYFLDPTARERLTVPIIPFDEIEKRGASMYRGEKIRARSIDSDASPVQGEEGGATPTRALQKAGDRHG